MTVVITLAGPTIEQLDLTPFRVALAPWLKTDQANQNNDPKSGSSPTDGQDGDRDSDREIAPQAIAALEQQVQFAIDYPREPEDPRELSEIPEIRLWFLRLDAAYPWLPYALDWQSGELARYVAMLVPHQFDPTEGIQFNPEALELWVMAKIFVLADWLPAQNLPARSRLSGLAQMLGYELADEFFTTLLDRDRSL